MTALIERNTTIPTKKAEVFSTAEDNQTTVEIHVLQGERKMAMDNKTIGKFQLTGIPPAPRGMPQVEVTFDIDANGILHVSAKDRATSKEQKIRIEASSGLSDSEIDKMVKDAEAHASEDEERRAKVEARNQLDSLVYQVEKTLTDNADKFSDEDRKPIEEAIQEVKSAMEQGDIEALKAAGDRLEKASHKLAEIMYKTNPAPGGSDPAAGDPNGSGTEADGDVIDAEVVEDAKTN